MGHNPADLAASLGGPLPPARAFGNGLPGGPGGDLGDPAEPGRAPDDDPTSTGGFTTSVSRTSGTTAGASGHACSTGERPRGVCCLCSMDWFAGLGLTRRRRSDGATIDPDDDVGGRHVVIDCSGGRVRPVARRRPAGSPSPSGPLAGTTTAPVAALGAPCDRDRRRPRLLRPVDAAADAAGRAHRAINKFGLATRVPAAGVRRVNFWKAETVCLRLLSRVVTAQVTFTPRLGP